MDVIAELNSIRNAPYVESVAICIRDAAHVEVEVPREAVATSLDGRGKEKCAQAFARLQGDDFVPECVITFVQLLMRSFL
jgi:hypothetical protein